MIDPVRFGRLEAKVDALAEELSACSSDVRSIRDTLAEKRGERRVGVALTGFLASLAGLFFGWLTR
jgi:hypothetical protein